MSAFLSFLCGLLCVGTISYVATTILEKVFAPRDKPRPMLLRYEPSEAEKMLMWASQTFAMPSLYAVAPQINDEPNNGQREWVSLFDQCEAPFYNGVTILSMWTDNVVICSGEVMN